MARDERRTTYREMISYRYFVVDKDGKFLYHTGRKDEAIRRCKSYDIPARVIDARSDYLVFENDAMKEE